ncbi:hypothetical protein [Pedobacter africanus]|uniref:Uncharacterized protein n=1 Tax=Pedobacter africanus TaxID=151894 RepID=A0A1W2CQD3_9SPHI|nr:hypothetical protein [Pedobacter africanus]SMC87429.1 hypothetical protein SAMN04488524_3088 [Pedobacter africanus]
MKAKIKKTNSTPEITHSSVNFSAEKIKQVAKEKKPAKSFLEELSNAINSGDDTAWRMWR